MPTREAGSDAVDGADDDVRVPGAWSAHQRGSVDRAPWSGRTTIGTIGLESQQFYQRVTFSGFCLESVMPLL